VLRNGLGHGLLAGALGALEQNAFGDFLFADHAEALAHNRTGQRDDEIADHKVFDLMDGGFLSALLAVQGSGDFLLGDLVEAANHVVKVVGLDLADEPVFDHFREVVSAREI